MGDFQGGGEGTQSRWVVMGGFSKGEYTKPMAFDECFFLLHLKIKRPGRLFRQIQYIKSTWKIEKRFRYRAGMGTIFDRSMPIVRLLYPPYRNRRTRLPQTERQINRDWFTTHQNVPWSEVMSLPEHSSKKICSLMPCILCDMVIFLLLLLLFVTGFLFYRTESSLVPNLIRTIKNLHAKFTGTSQKFAQSFSLSPGFDILLCFLRTEFPHFLHLCFGDKRVGYKRKQQKKFINKYGGDRTGQSINLHRSGLSFSPVRHHMTHLHIHTNLTQKIDPNALFMRQAIIWPLHLHHFHRLSRHIPYRQIRKACPYCPEIPRVPLNDPAQLDRSKTTQQSREVFRRRKQVPIDHWCVDAILLIEDGYATRDSILNGLVHYPLYSGV